MDKYILFNISKVSYTKSGKGPAVLFVHGFLEDKSMWEHFSPEFEATHTCLTIDLPGFGKSDVLPSMNMESMAEAVLAVLDAEEIRQVTYIGHSMGAYVGLALAEKAAYRFKGFALFHSHPFADSEAKKPNRLKAIEFVETHGVKAYAKSIFPSLFTSRFREKQREFVDMLIEDAASNSKEGVVGALEAMLNRKDRAFVLESLRCPVLFIIGKEDETIPLALNMEQSYLADRGSIRILNNVGHMGMYEAIDSCLADIKEFLEYTEALVL